MMHGEGDSRIDYAPDAHPFTSRGGPGCVYRWVAAVLPMGPSSVLRPFDSIASRHCGSSPSFLSSFFCNASSTLVTPFFLSVLVPS